MRTVAIVTGIIIIIVVIFGIRAANSTPAGPSSTGGTPAASSSAPSVLPTQAAATGLQVQDIAVGTGDEAVSGTIVTVNYTGTLSDGAKFDSSYDHGAPFRFPLGAGMVIKGWDQGVVGMKVGGKRHLIIPPELAYGDRSPMPLIPANATLVFDVELLKVERQ